MSKPVDKDSLPLDKPRRTPGHPTKSHVVKTKVDGREKIIRFGEQGAETAGKPKAGESDRMKAKRASFKARHAQNIAKGKSSPAYWANKIKWNEGGMVKMAAGGAMRMPRAEGAALQLIEQMRRAGGQEEFNPVLVSMREQQRARPARRPQAAPQAAAPLTAMQAPQMREEPLPLPPTPPAMRPDENPPPEAPPNPMRFDEGNPHVATAISMAQRYNLPPSIFLSLVQQESRFDPNARSPRGAIGLGQLMPATARELGVNPLDPEQNLEGSARYLRRMLDQFGSMELALAAYNAGPGRVRRAGNTIPNIRETQNYVPSVLRRAGVQQGEFAEGGLADLDQKYAEGGRVGRVAGAIGRAVRGRREPEVVGRAATDAAQEVPEVVESVTPSQNIVNQTTPKIKKDEYGFVDVKIGPSTGSFRERPDKFEIYSLKTPVANRGQGHARRVMDFIIEEADKTQKPAVLIASPLDRRTSTEKLVNFYGQYGFVPTGERANLMGDPIMIRQPVVSNNLTGTSNIPENPSRRGTSGLEDLDQKYAEGGEVMSDEEYDRRLLSRMKAQTGRVTEPTRAEQMQALRTAGREAAEGVADVLLPQSPLDFALMAAFGPGGRAARLAGSAALASLEPSEAEASRFRRLIRAYHGSPHKFEEFDISKIGTGEGAQVYGRGFYFAENPETAYSYKRKLAEGLFDKEGKAVRLPGSQTARNAYDFLRIYGDDYDQTISALRAYRDKSKGVQRAEHDDVLDQLDVWRGSGVRPGGHMYEVDLNAAPRDFLNWDVPLSQQSPEVRESLQRFGLRADPDAARAYDDALLDALYNDPGRALPSQPRDPTGADIYQRLLRMDPEEARVALMQAGIPGTRYLDAGSRGVGGTYNYAVFDPEIIDIRRRYAEGGLAQLDQKYAEGGIVSAEAAKYDPDAVDALVKQIEAEYV